jgi:7,8-dihydropterin-6-yl-methyl-4-(beta-D-ribofuranosyl)aminobenzene 5'-phosphate synthase
MKVRSVQALKITTLAENSCGFGAGSSRCLGQWGLSFLLETVDANGDNRKIIFDTGMHKQALLQNMKELKVNLSDVDCVVISHGHLDHTAATVEIAEAAEKPKVYAHPHVFLQRFFKDKKSKLRKIGIPKGEGQKEIEKAGGRIVLTSKPTEVVPGVWTTGQIERTTSFERPLPLSRGESLIIKVNGEEVEDQILDDQALWTQVNKFGPTIITGCAHAGTINTLRHVQKLGNFKQIYSLIGGTHLTGRSEEYIQQTISALRQCRLDLISPCHCTGFKAMAKLWQAFPEAFVWNFSGRVIDVGKVPEPRVI